jgi:hypothetical protein
VRSAARSIDLQPQPHPSHAHCSHAHSAQSQPPSQAQVSQSQAFSLFRSMLVMFVSFTHADARPPRALHAPWRSPDHSQRICHHQRVLNRTAVALAVLMLGCGGGPPKTAHAYHAASLWSLRASSKNKWKRVDGDTEFAYYVIYLKAYGRIALRTWDMSWPDDPDKFRAQLGDPRFLHNGYRYAITTTEMVGDDWLFRGKRLPAGPGQAVRAFVMVRTYEGARFVCLSMSEAGDEDDIEIELEACRTMRVKE